MNPRVPFSFIVPFLLLGLLALLSCEDASSDELAGLGDKVGVLEGTVYFVGVPCPLTYPPPGPPCDGPLPDFEVIVFHRDGSTEAAWTRTDERGDYRVVLPEGEYVILTQNGINELFIVINEATVASGAVTTLHLTIDTGIR
jgi:hypothetical protein